MDKLVQDVMDVVSSRGILGIPLLAHQIQYKYYLRSLFRKPASKFSIIVLHTL